MGGQERTNQMAHRILEEALVDGALEGGMVDDAFDRLSSTHVRKKTVDMTTVSPDASLIQDL